MLGGRLRDGKKGRRGAGLVVGDEDVKEEGWWKCAARELRRGRARVERNTARVKTRSEKKKMRDIGLCLGNL